MKQVEPLYHLMLIGFILFIAIPADAQYVTIARKIKSMRTSSADIATVIIDAGATNVYRAVIDTLTTDPPGRTMIIVLSNFPKNPTLSRSR